MNDRNDDAQSYALLAVAGVIALVIGGVIVLAIARGTTSASSGADAPALAASAGAVTPMAELQAEVPEPSPDSVIDLGQQIQFEPGSDTLTVAASQALTEVADAARRRADAIVAIFTFQASPADDAGLARRRALAVRDALLADGVAPDQVVIEASTAVADEADLRAVDRVDLHLR